MPWRPRPPSPKTITEDKPVEQQISTAVSRQTESVIRNESKPDHVNDLLSGTLAALQRAYVKLEDTIRSFQEILDGKHDDIPEVNFYLKGSIEDVLAANAETK
jgi:F-type H+-transporting ATPase subunit beta